VAVGLGGHTGLECCQELAQQLLGALLALVGECPEQQQTASGFATANEVPRKHAGSGASGRLHEQESSRARTSFDGVEKDWQASRGP
jgi:hypothetical protein